MMRGRLAGGPPGRRRSGREAGAARAHDADGRIADHDEDRRAAALRPPRRDPRAAAAAGGSSGGSGVVALRARRRAGAQRQGRTKRRRSGRRSTRRRATVPDEALFGGTGLESASNILALATAVLDARIAWARGSQTDAIRLWTERRRAADKVPYDEPPVFFYPVRESLGAALLLSGKRRRSRAGVPRRSREASAKCPVAVRPAREPASSRARPRTRPG